MGLISRKKTRQTDSGEPADYGLEGAATVEVTIDGPDAERLTGLIDMSEVAAVLRRAAKGDTPADG
jgi:hypothetical protein